MHSFGDTAFRPLDVAAPNERASDKTRIYYSRCPSDWISQPGHPRKQEEKVRECISHEISGKLWACTKHWTNVMSFFVKKILFITIGYTKAKLRRYVAYLNCICPDKFILISKVLIVLFFLEFWQNYWMKSLFVSKDYLCSIPGLSWGWRRPCAVGGGRRLVLPGRIGRRKHFWIHWWILLSWRFLCRAFSRTLDTPHTTNCNTYTDNIKFRQDRTKLHS